MRIPKLGVISFPLGILLTGVGFIFNKVAYENKRMEEHGSCARTCFAAGVAQCGPGANE
jgi:hypothetical protein